MKFMDKLAAWLEAKIMPIASVVGAQKHLGALRDGFVGTLPITMVGAMAVLFNWVIVRKDSLLGEKLNKIDSYKESVQPWMDKYILATNGMIWYGTLAMTTLFVIITISYSLARAYDVDGLSAALVALSAYIILVPEVAPGNATGLAGAKFQADKGFESAVTTIQQALAGVDPKANLQVIGDHWGLLPWNYFNSDAMFAGMILALVVTQIFVVITNKGWTIKMPEQVPPAVSKAFSSVIPALIVLFLVGFIGLFFKEVVGMSWKNWIWTTIQKPLNSLGQSPATYIFLVVLAQIFWFFGLHGFNMVGPILDAMYGPALNKNTELAQAGQAPINALTRNFVDVYAMHGGSGATGCLLVAIFIFSKKQETRELAKLGAAPGIFQINEPVIFGLPLVLNPMYFIPFLITPPILLTVAWVFTEVIPFAAYLKVPAPWVTPPIISAFVGTGGDFKAAILAAATFLLGVIIYAPFVIAANKVGEDNV